MKAALVAAMTLVACSPSPSSPAQSAPRTEVPPGTPVAPQATATTEPPSSDVLALNGVVDPLRDAGPAPSLAWTAANPSKWEAAVDRYKVVVRPIAMVPLEGRTVAFAKYIQSMHQRIHPWFAEAYLGTLPPMTPVTKKLATRVEIVLDKSGAVSALGVVTKSGDRDFDIAVLEAVSRAAPFEPPADELRSSDGNVYVHWELRRDETYACAPMLSRPFVLKLAASPSP